MPAPAGQENVTVPHVSGQPSTPRSGTSHAQCSPLPLETGPLERLMPKARYGAHRSSQHVLRGTCVPHLAVSVPVTVFALPPLGSALSDFK